MFDPEYPKDPHLNDAVAVSDYVLEATRKAYMSRDFLGFKERFIIPQVIDTFDSDYKLETFDDLKSVFDNVCKLLENQGILDLQRRTISALFLSPERVQFTYVTQHLRPDLSLTEEIFVHGTLHLFDGIWRIEDSRLATDSAAVIHALSPKSQC